MSSPSNAYCSQQLALALSLALLTCHVCFTSARPSLTWRRQQDLPHKIDTESSSRNPGEESRVGGKSKSSLTPDSHSSGEDTLQTPVQEHPSRRVLDDGTSAKAVPRQVEVIVPEGEGYCLDGSRPAYYFRPGTGDGANSWIIYLIGGGWCFTWEECLARKASWLGSTSLLPPKGGPLPVNDPKDVFGNGTLKLPMEGHELPGYLSSGMLSTNCHVNPDFCTWNVAAVLYCDGGAHLGHAGAVKSDAGDELVFSGRNGLQQVLADLMTNQGLDGAQNALLSGCSAGAHSVSVLCDWVTGQLAPTTKAKCLTDAGMFLEFEDRNGVPSFFNNLQSLHQLQRAGLSAPAACLKEYEAEPWRCLLSETSLKFLNTPTFMVNSLYDFVALQFVYFYVGYPATPAAHQVMACLQTGEGCTPKERDAFQLYGETMKQRVAEIVEKQGDKFGYFIMEGADHCCATSKLWSKVMPDGKIMAHEVAKWF